MILRTVCTLELQTFHRPAKSFFGSPIKAEALPCKSRDLSLILNPVVLDPDIIYKQSYCENQRNRAINYAACYKTTMPFLQLFAPADTYCAIWDHNYTNIDPEERLLDELKLLSVTAEDIETIERETKGQGASKIFLHIFFEMDRT